jgi:hypothetical protein
VVSLHRRNVGKLPKKTAHARTAAFRSGRFHPENRGKNSGISLKIQPSGSGPQNTGAGLRTRYAQNAYQQCNTAS